MPAELRGSVYTTSKSFGIRWIEHGRRRYRSGFEFKKEARQWFADDVRPRLNGGKREHSTSTLSDFSETWLQAHAAGREPEGRPAHAEGAGRPRRAPAEDRLTPPVPG